MPSRLRQPEVYEALEDRGVDYVRIPANKKLEWEIADILFRPGQAQRETAGALQTVELSGGELVQAPTDRKSGELPTRLGTAESLFEPCSASSR